MYSDETVIFGNYDGTTDNRIKVYRNKIFEITRMNDNDFKKHLVSITPPVGLWRKLLNQLFTEKVFPTLSREEQSCYEDSTYGYRDFLTHQLEKFGVSNLKKFDDKNFRPSNQMRQQTINSWLDDPPDKKKIIQICMLYDLTSNEISRVLNLFGLPRLISQSAWDATIIFVSDRIRRKKPFSENPPRFYDCIHLFTVLKEEVDALLKDPERLQAYTNQKETMDVDQLSYYLRNGSAFAKIVEDTALLKKYAEFFSVNLDLFKNDHAGTAAYVDYWLRYENVNFDYAFQGQLFSKADMSKISTGLSLAKYVPLLASYIQSSSFKTNQGSNIQVKDVLNGYHCFQKRTLEVTTVTNNLLKSDRSRLIQREEIIKLGLLLSMPVMIINELLWKAGHPALNYNIWQEAVIIRFLDSIIAYEISQGQVLMFSLKAQPSDYNILVEHYYNEEWRGDFSPQDAFHKDMKDKLINFFEIASRFDNKEMIQRIKVDPVSVINALTDGYLNADQ